MREEKVTNEHLMLAIKEIIQKVDKLDTRVISLEEKVNKLDSRITSVEEKTDKINTGVVSLEEKVDKVDSKLDVLSTELLSTRADVNILKKAR
ncbi:hypothetical protein [Oceanobacillus jeddahense]|uniref:hypothetical protein n=1 Tax=Oceanobacillus jeddahense TaxID=1462527 RepID=UPI000694448B|nr:hypothetical protein [Oceanobacillus jeddahense]